MFEFHVFDACRCLSAALDATLGSRAWNPFIVATRDPLARWESSFNWDLHNLVLSTGAKQPPPVFKAYPTVRDLAQGIVDQRADALKFGRFGHMGMGISWYLPEAVVESLSGRDVHMIRLEHINEDFGAFVRACGSRVDVLPRQGSASGAGHGRFSLATTKTDYKSHYPRGTFSALDYRDLRTIDALKHYLSADYIVHEKLLSLPRAS